MKGNLQKIGLTADNAVVIGSGILQALGIRQSNDIDIVASQAEYDRLKTSGKFSTHKTQYKKEVLTDELFEIGTSWDILGKNYRFDDLKKESVVIDNVRYITLDFLYKIKTSWIAEKTVRPKDIADLRLIEEYNKRQTNISR